MFGLTPSPLLELPHPRLPEDDPAEVPDPRSGSRRVAAVLLSDGDLRKELANGRLVLDPWDPAMLQPSSIDVRLDRYFRVFQNSRYTHIDPREQQDELTTPVEPDGDEPFVLHPGEFVLGSTFETVTLPDDLAGRLEGKSSLGRLGLLTHSTAGFIDPGFTGHITLELSNVANLPITLWPGMKIGQLCLFRLSSPAERPYGSEGVGSRYQGQRGPTPSRAHLNFHRVDTRPPVASRRRDGTAPRTPAVAPGHPHPAPAAQRPPAPPVDAARFTWQRLTRTRRGAAGLAIGSAALLLWPFAGVVGIPWLVGLGVLLLLRLLRLDGLLRGWDVHLGGLVVVVGLMFSTGPVGVGAGREHRRARRGAAAAAVVAAGRRRGGDVRWCPGSASGSRPTRRRKRSASQDAAENAAELGLQGERTARAGGRRAAGERSRRTTCPRSARLLDVPARADVVRVTGAADCARRARRLAQPRRAAPSTSTLDAPDRPERRACG